MPQHAIPERGQIAPQYQWTLTDIYPTTADWERDFAAIEAAIAGMDAVREALSPTKESILATLKAQEAAHQKLERAWGYAYMKHDEDGRESQAQAMNDRIQSLGARVGAATAFIAPALLQMPEALLRDCLADPAFADYDRLLFGLLRNRAHVLPAEQEALLAQADEIGSAAQNTYGMLTTVDMEFPTIEGEDGQPTLVNSARLLTLLSSHDARVRRDAWLAMMGAYARYGNTFAALYAASVKNDGFHAHARGFASARAHSLFDSEIPETVYDALLDAVAERLPALHRYMRLKQKGLGLETLNLWDLYAETTRDFDIKVSYEEAFALILEALAPLGEDYIATLRAAQHEGWVDAFENQGKRGGAYSSGVYGVHPFVLMSFEGTLDSTSTLAHELGHAMHSHLSAQKQPFAKYDYTLFAAEVASTVNEILLTSYLLGKYPEAAAQQSLLGMLLEQFRGTVFRQTMFAAFEKETHLMQDRDEALTAQALSDVYEGINQRYYGAGCTVDPAVRAEWMRIPHFYRAFYVYQYATGFSAAVCIARKILREGAPAVAGYRKFLEAGGSMPPIDALRMAGVDMETPEPVREALDWFEELVGKFEGLV
ncbi:MAG: oligoendopeptidase F [Oscillospiraceae bacterium]|jgi:oligoendopeptidase F|nr:oligoendopeptidase F [Oscillospiraceae bacterium]